jgi:hypothetical protein
VEMSAQMEAAVLASQMTDARDLSKAGKTVVVAGKDKSKGIKMSYAHKENMAVKAGNISALLEDNKSDACALCLCIPFARQQAAML